MANFGKLEYSSVLQGLNLEMYMLGDDNFHVTFDHLSNEQQFWGRLFITWNRLKPKIKPP